METKHLFSTNPSFLLQRLIEQYEKQDKLIVAYDFDDTVKPYWCADCCKVQSILRRLRDNIDAYFIVYTCNKDHEKIKKFLDKWDIPYDSINENAPFAPDIDGKLFYNVFLDDKAGLGEVVNTLDQFLYLVLNGYIKKTEPKDNLVEEIKSKKENLIDEALFKFAISLDKWFDSMDRFLGVGSKKPPISHWENSNGKVPYKCVNCGSASNKNYLRCPNCKYEMTNGDYAWDKRGWDG